MTASDIRLRAGTPEEVVDLALRVPEFDDPHGLASNGGVVNQQLDHIFVAESDGRLVGFRACYRQSPDAFGVWMAAVLPEARNRGIYGALFDAQNAHLKSIGARSVRTTVRAPNLLMQGILRNRGFRIVERYFNAKMQCELVVMMLEL